MSFYKDGVAIQKNVPVVGTVEKTFTDSGKYKVEISAVEKFLDGDNTGKAEYEFTIDRGQEGAGSMPEEGSIGGMPE